MNEYDDFEDSRNYTTYNGFVFIRRCPRCLRFVKADEEIWFTWEGCLADKDNATCTQDGRIKMIEVGFV